MATINTTLEVSTLEAGCGTPRFATLGWRRNNLLINFGLHDCCGQAELSS